MSSEGFSAQERAAMKERAKELEAEAKRPRGGKAAAEELDLLAKIAAMPDGDRQLAERIHAIVTTAAPDLKPKLWYGQPAWAGQGGKAVCFFRSGAADGEPYSTFGFSSQANLTEADGFWPTSYALTDVTAKTEKAIAALVKQAVS